MKYPVKSHSSTVDKITAESIEQEYGYVAPAPVAPPPQPEPVSAFSLIRGNRRLAGSLIGGIKETQEMLDFCAAHGIVCDIEMIAIQQVNAAYERMLKSDVKYRFVIDMASLKA